MKKLLFAIAFLMPLAMALCAQPGSLDELSVYNYKKPIGRSELKVNAIRDFRKRFGEWDNPTWSSNGDHLRAKFSRENIKHMVDYDQKGRWVSTILVYDEAQLKTDLRRTVKSNYIDYVIVKVIEVKIGKTHVHFIKLENRSSLLTLHIMNAEITEIENYRKG
jgi:hypothetical protein